MQSKQPDASWLCLQGRAEARASKRPRASVQVSEHFVSADDLSPARGRDSRSGPQRPRRRVRAAARGRGGGAQRPALPARSRARSAPRRAALPAGHVLPPAPSAPLATARRRPASRFVSGGAHGEAARCPPPRARAPRPGAATAVPGPGAEGAPGWAPSGGS